MTDQAVEQVRIVGVATEEISIAPGAQKYKVPIRVSRPLDHREQDELRKLWDGPPQSSTRQSGIMTFGPDKSLVFLDCDIDTVRDVHAKPLGQCVAALNRRIKEIAAEKAQAKADAVDRETARGEELRRIEAVARDITFD